MSKIIKTLLYCAFLVLSQSVIAQNNLKSIETLLDNNDPAWPIVQKWIDSAKNKVQILPVDTNKNKLALYEAQVSTYATLGAVIYNTGGILIDQGWIRILGSGSEKLNRSVSEWNKGKTITEFGDQPGYLLIADDAVGGFFAINYGALGEDIKNVYYLEPNSLNWQPLGAGYGEFLLFCLDSDLSKFYNGLRWATWDKYIAGLDGNKMYTFYPALWTKTGQNIDKVSKRLVSVEEQWQTTLKAKQDLTTSPKTDDNKH